MKKSMDLDMTQGKPMKLILLFSLPILFGNIFQQFYNVIDTAVVGNVLGDNALAAVGAASPFFSMVTVIATGSTNGFSIVLARYYGAKDDDSLKKALFMTYVFSAVLAVFLTVAALIGIKPLLRLLGTPDSIMADCVSYLRIALGGLAVTICYNMFAGIMRAIGNSVMPLVFLIIASVINVVLDFWFVAGIKLGVGGAALATVIAQLISVFACVWYMIAKCRDLHISREHIVFEKKIAIDLTSTAFSMALMLLVVSIGNVALQSSVNSFNEEVIAAHTVARKILDLFLVVFSTVSVTASTFASQNYGAGRIDRIKTGIMDSLFLGYVWSTFGILVAFLAGPVLARGLTGSTNPNVIDTAVQYIRINFPFFYCLVPLLVLRSSLQGLNRKIVPIIGSVIELVGKFVVVAWLAPNLGYLGVCISEPIIWTVCMCLVSWDFVAHVLHGSVLAPKQEEKAF
ncbi:MAG: MATE family efflux transporter [Clostridium sp.]|nr:MATE family efflux transporter [Clostridium sp.]